MKKLEEKITQSVVDGRLQTGKIFRHFETPKGEYEETMSFKGDCILESVILYPKDSCIDRIEAKRKYKGNDPLGIRKEAAKFSIDFRKNYCEDSEDSKCVFYDMIRALSSTTGKDMRKSIARYGKKSDSYKCIICDGNNKSCPNYTSLKK